MLLVTIFMSFAGVGSGGLGSTGAPKLMNGSVSSSMGGMKNLRDHINGLCDWKMNCPLASPMKITNKGKQNIFILI